MSRAPRWIGVMTALLLTMAAVAPLGASSGAQAPPRIVAVGDLHGDYDAYVAILRAAGLVDRRGRWAGGDSIFVQTGDVADRGPDSLRIMRHMMRLQREAARAGGRVVALVGNHEAMNVTGDLRYVHPGEYAAFADRRSERRRAQAYDANRAAIEAAYRARDPAMSAEAIRAAWLAATPLGWVEHRAAWGPDGELGRWVVRNPAAVLIDGTLFVHGGIGPAYAAMPLEEINRRTAAALAAADDSPEAIINDPAGPLWYRGLADSAVLREGELDALLRAYGARRIVVGHTPQLDGIALRDGGRLALIDTGIALHYGGRRAWLEIRGGEAIAREIPAGRGGAR